MKYKIENILNATINNLIAINNYNLLDNEKDLIYNIVNKLENIKENLK